MADPVVTVECVDTFDPKVVRVFVHADPVWYGFDIPSNLYPSIALINGWPTNPCDRESD